MKTESNSKIEGWQGDALNLSQALPAAKQLNLDKLGDAAGLKGNGCSTKPGSILESRAVVYLDHHSATRPCSAAIERMSPYFETYWAAGFAPHKMGQELVASLDARYQMIYDFAGAGLNHTFVFTSCGAEAVNQVFWSAFLEVARKEGKTQFIVSCVEDAPTMQSAKRMEELGCTVKIAPVDAEGRIDVKLLADLITPRTALISVSLAQGLTGVIQPIEEIALLAREKKVLLHVEASYAAGKYVLSFDDLGVDYLTFSGDRIHSVKGSGGLFIKEGSPVAPLIVGGSEQGGLRGGTFDVPSFMALSAAVQQASLYLDAMNLETVRLRDLFEASILKEVAGAELLFKDVLRLPNTSAILFPKVHQEALLYLLNRKGVYASIGGPYCQHLSRTLVASNIDEKLAERALSFSLSRMTTEEEVIRAAKIVGEAVRSLEGVSEGIFL